MSITASSLPPPVALRATTTREPSQFDATAVTAPEGPAAAVCTTAPEAASATTTIPDAQAITTRPASPLMSTATAPLTSHAG